VAEVHSQSDLLRLRAANSTLNALATPLAFRSIQFANTDKSLERFIRLANYPKFSGLIHEVVYQYEEADRSTCIIFIVVSRLTLVIARIHSL
jgi:hypothetical protein